MKPSPPSPPLRGFAFPKKKVWKKVYFFIFHAGRCGSEVSFLWKWRFNFRFSSLLHTLSTRKKTGFGFPR
jgi:hypothetical protein